MNTITDPIDARSTGPGRTASALPGRIGRLLLRGATALSTVLLSVVVLHASVDPTWGHWLQAAVLAPLALVLCRAALAPADRDETGTRAGGPILNTAGMAAAGAELLAACRREQRNLSMAVFDCSDMLEVREIYGSAVSRQVVARVLARVTALAGERGLAARTGPAEFTVLMPLSQSKAQQAIGRIMGTPARIELDVGDEEIVLVPEVAVESVDEDACVMSLYRSMVRGLDGAKENERRRRQHLRAERERHSRPMGLHGASAVRSARRPVMPPALGTMGGASAMPVALGMP